MDPVNIKELWMLLGEKDVQIYQLLRELELRKKESEELAKKLNAILIIKPEEVKDGR